MSYKGDVKFQVGDEEHILVFTIDALIELEEIFERSVQEVGAMFGEGLRMKDLRTVFHIGLATHHPDVDEGAAGYIMSLIGVTRAGELVGEAFLAAFGGTDAGEVADKGPARPRKRAGIGRRASTSGSTTSSAPSPTSDG